MERPTEEDAPRAGPDHSHPGPLPRAMGEGIGPPLPCASVGEGRGEGVPTDLESTSAVLPIPAATPDTRFHRRLLRGFDALGNHRLVIALATFVTIVTGTPVILDWMRG